MPIRHRTRSAAAVAALVAAALLLPAAPARAARTVTITGGGWGHGIGMSQYGAYGRAINGKGAEDILEHYYSGAQVSTVDIPARIRVGLVQYVSTLSFTSSAFRSGGGEVAFKVAGTPGAIAKGPAGTEWRVESSRTGGMRLYRNGVQVKKDGVSVFGDPAHALILKYQKQGSLVRVAAKQNNYAYGRLEIGTLATDRCNRGYCLRLVLSVSMQKYLYGLGEVPASWPAGALRAQAIAGRTYAYEKIERLGQDRYPCGCAVYDSTIDQAYIGDAKRTGSGEWWDDWRAAVNDTKDQVILHSGSPIQALYSSSSGGHTENNENVWGGSALAYLRGVPDDADAVDANPNHTWTVKMPWSDFQAKLNAEFGIGRLVDFILVKPFGVSGRVTVVKDDGRGGVKIVGSDKTVRVSGWSIRAALGLKDTLFRVSIPSPSPSPAPAPSGRV